MNSYSMKVLKVESKQVGDNDTLISLSCKSPVNLDVGDEIEIWIAYQARISKKVTKSEKMKNVDDFNILDVN